VIPPIVIPVIWPATVASCTTATATILSAAAVPIDGSPPVLNVWVVAEVAAVRLAVNDMERDTGDQPKGVSPHHSFSRSSAL
jgi:hypothetical protein